MQRTIVAQKEYIAVLEARLGTAPSDTSPAAAPQPRTPHDIKRDILVEIAARLRRGEINLPVYPSINATFHQMLQAQASLGVRRLSPTHLRRWDAFPKRCTCWPTLMMRAIADAF